MSTKSSNKKALISSNQIIQKMKGKGITFEKGITEVAAEKYMRNNLYYYKLASYRKNYKVIDNKYQNLDIAYLINLSELDRDISEVIFRMTNEIEVSCMIESLRICEGSLRTKIFDPNEIVYDFYKSKKSKSLNATEKMVVDIRKPLNNNLGNSVIHKYKSLDNNDFMNQITVWEFLEIASFSTVYDFLKFVAAKGDSYSSLNTFDTRLIENVRNFRNMCAHNHNIINNIAKCGKPAKIKLVSKDLDRIKLKNKSMYGINVKISSVLNLIYAHSKIMKKDCVSAITRLYRLVNICEEDFGIKYGVNQELKNAFDFIASYAYSKMEVYN